MRFQTYVLEEYLESNGGIHRYRALDEKLDREVCVVICEASDTHPWEQLERYLDLVRKVASVSHPGLATVYSCGRYEAGVYVASQLLSKPVRDNVLAERLDWREAKPLLLALAEALQKAAEAGVPHGSLNGQSFRMDVSGVPKVSGLGEGVLLTGHLADEPYAAPERKAGGESSVASDLYSFAVWALGLLTGCSPRDAANSVTLDASELADASFGMENVPFGVLMVLRQMASTSAFQRPKGYLPLIAELTGSGQTATTINWKKGARVSASEQPAEAKGGMAFAMVHCLVALLLGGVGGWAFWKWRDGTRPAAFEKQDLMAESSKMVAERLASSDDDTDKAKSADEDDLQEKAKFARLPLEFRRLRPKPENLKFDEDKIQEYISKLPLEYATAETERARRMMGMRDYIFASLRMPYRPPKSEGLRLRDGSLLRGFIPMGTEEQGLTVRPFDDARQSLPVTNLKIEDLEWSEIWSMLDYYGKMREDMADSEARASVFEHYLNSAVACDWYGYREEAALFIRKALKINPNGKTLVEKLGFEQKKPKD
ncbi:MAG: hypothetical protein IKS92_01920, partial [Victivallales bacterium]|nr:hypothetical protein [Victivallales bacterium]